MLEYEDAFLRQIDINQIQMVLNQMPLHLCVTSAKTRENLKQKSFSNVDEEDISKIWVIEKNKCTMHSKSNESKSHTETIKDFLDVFTSLPEVSDQIIEGEDLWDIRKAYLSVVDKIINYVRDQIKFFQSNVSSYITKNQSVWYVEIIENYLTSEVYSR